MKDGGLFYILGITDIEYFTLMLYDLFVFYCFSVCKWLPTDLKEDYLQLALVLETAILRAVSVLYSPSCIYSISLDIYPGKELDCYTQVISTALCPERLDLLDD